MERSVATGGDMLGTKEHLVHEPLVAVVDNGAQLVDVIYWNVVELGIPAEIIPFTRGSDPLDIDGIKSHYKAVIYTGSSESVNDEGAPQIPTELLDGSIPSLGICFGGQAIAKALGGKVAKVEVDGQHQGEYGQTEISVEPSSLIYNGLKTTKVLMSHGDSILAPPPGFRVTGRSNQIIASFESPDGRIIGTQYHPEVSETEEGMEIMRRFLTDVAEIAPDPSYTLEVALSEYMEQEEAKIAEILERGEHIVGLVSGGIDSMVAASSVFNVAKRLKRLDQIKFYYVDTGHNRIEDDKIIDLVRTQGWPIEKIDAADEFFHSRVVVKPKQGPEFLAKALVDEADPAIKRLVIGTIFKHLSDRLIEQVNHGTDKKVWLMQGTNNSDIIESGGRGGNQIKGHHNVEAMDEKRQANELVEPMAGLMKYHVRLLGENRYNLPDWFTAKQPFPGPGISPRIIVNLSGELPSPHPELQARLDSRVDELSNGAIRAHMVTMKTVGQKGDGRSLADVAFLDGDADWQLLARIARKIPNEFGSLNRVFYVPGLTLDRQSIKGTVSRDDERFTDELRFMEEIHRETMLRTGMDPYLSQHFVGTFGVDLTGSGKPTLGLRLFITGNNLDAKVKRRTGRSKETFRTGVAAIPGVQVEEKAFSELVSVLQSNLRFHGSLAYDLTSKPPASTEWE